MFDFLSGFRHSSRNIAAHVLLGKKGEDDAVKFLKKLGYTVLHRNVRVGRRDEIDIIASDPEDGVLVFAEVKTRASASDDFRPELSVTPEKRQSLFRAARRWVGSHGYDGGYRIDLVCVAGGKVVEHYKEIDVRGVK